MKTAHIGVLGLGVMGRNLARNLARHGYSVAAHDRLVDKVRSLVEEHGDEGVLVACATPEALVAALERPRTVILMAPAGPATDAAAECLSALLEPGDIIVDAGNSHVADTRRREAALWGRGLRFVGVGVSGGEEGALLGPSIMAGGTAEAYATLGPVLESIAATVDGTPCCARVGSDGAGHFVKMVHNGIEYAAMQGLAEAYHLLRTGLGATPAEVGDLFATWNDGELESFLLATAAEVLRQVDAKTGLPLVDVILDEAGQKGTGRWAVQSALDLGVPVTAMGEAAFTRAASSSRESREAVRLALGAIEPVAPVPTADRVTFSEDVRQALRASTIVAYAQGFEQIRAGSDEYGWSTNLAEVARIWRGGCIIRARLLDDIVDAYRRDPTPASLLADPDLASELAAAIPAWRRAVSRAALVGVPAPTLASSLAYVDALRTERLPATLIQGQRDLFGAHTYRRVDADGVFHTLWSGDRSEVEA